MNIIIQATTSLTITGGGKFGNGAMTAAFGYLFNFCAHNKCFDRPFRWVDAAMHWTVGQGERVTDGKASEIPLEGATYIKNKDGTYQIHTFSPIYGTVTRIRPLPTSQALGVNSLT